LQRVGSINTYLELSKDDQASETQPAATQPSMQPAQQTALLLSVLRGNQDGLSLDALQYLVANSMPPDVLRDSVSALRNKGMVEVAASSDPLRPSVKITEKGLDQLSFLI
jgi:hypothetical protein